MVQRTPARMVTFQTDQVITGVAERLDVDRRMLHRRMLHVAGD